MLGKVIQILGVAALATAALQASTFSFQGTFSSDDQVQLFNFTTSSNATLINFGYGGGTNAASTNFPAGGFDNLLTIYLSDGTEVGSFDDDFSCTHTNSHNGGCQDAYFNGLLNAGSYILALTVSGNVPNGDLVDGFSQQGNGNFTANDCSPAHPFCSFGGFPNNGNWALDIIGVTSASQVSAVPEPISISLGAGGLALLGLVYRRRMPRFIHALLPGEKA